MKSQPGKKQGTTKFKSQTTSCVADVYYDSHRLRRLFGYFKEREELLRLALKKELPQVELVAVQALLHEIEGILIWMVTNLPPDKERESF